MRFRRKPVIVDAVPWGGDPEMTRSGYDKHGVEYTVLSRMLYTSQGPIPIDPGDWIITQEDGKKDLCKSDVFKKHYERVPEVCPSCKKNPPVEEHPDFLCMTCIKNP